MNDKLKRPCWLFDAGVKKAFRFEVSKLCGRKCGFPDACRDYRRSFLGIDGVRPGSVGGSDEFVVTLQ